MRSKKQSYKRYTCYLALSLIFGFFYSSISLANEQTENNFDVIQHEDSSFSGSLFKVRESSTDTFYLWDSEAGVVKGFNDETRHVRVRIEEGHLNHVKNHLTSSTVHANGNSLTPKAEIKRDHVRIALGEHNFLTLYPYAETAELLVNAFKEMFIGHTVGITKKGLIYIIDGTSIIYGYLDYYITKPKKMKFGHFSFSEVYQENGFDTIMITYPSGTKQKMYFFKVDINEI